MTVMSAKKQKCVKIRKFRLKNYNKFLEANQLENGTNHIEKIRVMTEA